MADERTFVRQCTIGSVPYFTPTRGDFPYVTGDTKTVCTITRARESEHCQAGHSEAACQFVPASCPQRPTSQTISGTKSGIAASQYVPGA